MNASDGSGLEHCEVSKGGVFAPHFVRQDIGNGSMGHGKDESVGAFFATVKLHGGNGAIFNLELASGGAQSYFPALLLDGGLAAVIEFGEGDGGNAHAVAGAIGEKGLPENIDAVARVGFFQLFVQRAD